MTLANAIDVEIILRTGLVTFGPLTLFVSVVEALVFWRLLRVSFWRVLRRLLWANVLSTLAAVPVALVDDWCVYASGIRESIPAFVYGYRWVAPLLVAMYFAKSVAVEGLCVTIGALPERLERSRRSLWRAVVLANVASYCFVGPLFYYVTRPGFADYQPTFDAAWTANADVPVYYIDAHDKFIKRVYADGHAAETLVPYPADEFLMNADGTVFVYSTDRNRVCAHRAGDPVSVQIAEYSAGFFMRSTSLAPDNRRVLYRTGPSITHLGQDAHQRLTAFDLDTAASTLVTTLPSTATLDEWTGAVAWSADGNRIYVETMNGAVLVLAAEPPYECLEKTNCASLGDPNLVVNYVSSDGSMLQSIQRATHNGYTVETRFAFNRGAYIRSPGRPDSHVRGEYGLLNLDFPSPSRPAFLPQGAEFVVAWGEQLYIIDLENHRIGLLCPGERYVLPTPRFRVHFEPPDY